MNLCVLTSYEGISAYILSKILPSLSHHNITVFYTNKTKKNLPEKLQEISKADQDLLHKHQDVFATFQATELNHINTKDLAKFSNSAPDLVVSIRHMSILKDEVIGIPKLGVINLHSGALPTYRGVMATFWAMKNQEHSIASTLHKIENSKIDKGSIISSKSVIVDYALSYYENLIRLYDKGYQQILDAIDTMNKVKNISSTPMPEGGAYYSWPTENSLEDIKFNLS